MLEAILEGFATAVSWEVLPYIALGSLLGLLIGVIPGVGGNFALAILIPFTFRMSPATGLAFILGAHAPVAQGGGVTAILFGIPGTGQNAATLLDGPPMTAKGQGGEAVGAALAASFMGGVFGALILALMIPMLRYVLPVFGPPEFFMLILVALTFIAALGGKDADGMSRGLIAGILGLLFSFVGMCDVTGVRRFTFGFLQLWNGLPFIPVMLGLFAVAEMLDLWCEGGSLARNAKELKGEAMKAMQQQIFKGVLGTLKRWWLVIRCGAIGTIIGIIPGMGAASSCFLAYAHARQTSKNPEEFGKGSIEGVIGPESANNATEGGALATTLAFGIPGSSSMALLLVAMLILGLNPGRELMTQHLDVVFLIISTVVLGNLIGTIAGVFVANPLTRITFLRSTILVPILLAVVLTGAYVVQSSMFDIILAFVFGLLGYAMKKLDYSRPAFIIGLILGIMLERNFFLSLKLYGQTFFLRPVALVLLITTVVVLLYNLKVFNIKKGDKGERRKYTYAG